MQSENTSISRQINKLVYLKHIFATGIIVFAMFMLLRPAEVQAETVSEISAYSTVTQTGSGLYIVIDKSHLEEDFAKYFNRVTRCARDNATYYRPATIVVPAGTYYVSGRMYIYSNTTVIATGANIRSDDAQYGMMMVGNPNSTTTSGYNMYQNIAIEGGTWDIDYNKWHSQNKSSFFLKAAYVTNLSIRNATIKNAYRGHMIELAACDGVNIDGCTFNGATGADSYEAIQFDVMHSSSTVNGYKAYNDDPVINATVSNCTFKNLIRGVGSHHMVVGRPYRNIKILNNTFKAIEYNAIYAVGWENSTISGNIIRDSYNGICVEREVKHLYFPNDGSVSYAPTVQTLNMTISNNQIKTRRTPDANDACTGIRVIGSSIRKATSNGIPAAKYTLSKVTIANNKVTGGARWEIAVKYADNVKITNNSVDGLWHSTISARGILVSNSADCSVLKNTVQNHNGKNLIGIDIDSGCKNINVKTNKLYKMRGSNASAIAIRGSSSYVTVCENVIKDVKHYGIYTKDIKQTTISDNRIYNVKDGGGSGIMASYKVTNTTIFRNKIKDVGKYGIYIKQGKSIKVTSNSVFSVKSGSGAGVMISNNANTIDVASNTIKDIRKDGICLKQGKNINLRSNNIQRCGKYGIYGIKGKNIIIKNNRISKAGNYSIRIKKNVKMYSINNNKIQKCGHNNEEKVG